MNQLDLQLLSPFIIIAAAVIVLLLLIAFYRRHLPVFILSAGAMAGAVYVLWRISPLLPHYIRPLFVLDRYAAFFAGLIFCTALALVLLSFDYLKRTGGRVEEYYIILLLGTLGASVLVISSHFISIFLGLELLSVSLYVLIAYLPHRDRGLEAGIKYLILAASASAFLLFGMALIYYETGTMSILQPAEPGIAGGMSAIALSGTALMIAGIGFKLAVVPFHLWTPDVYQGAPAPVTAFIATISKGAMFALIFRFFIGVDMYDYPVLTAIFYVIAVASMFTGNLLALLQDNLKRLLAYSSIAHLGYLLVAFIAGGTAAASFYLAAYFITTIGAFAVVSVLSGAEKEAEEIEAYQGLYRHRPWIAAVMTAMLLSLAGIPLTAGFVGKFYILLTGVDASLWSLVIILVINSAVGLYYYLRVIVAIFSRTEQVQAQPAVPAASAAVLVTAAVLLLWLGVYPPVFIETVQEIVSGLYFP